MTQSALKLMNPMDAGRTLRAAIEEVRAKRERHLAKRPGRAHFAVINHTSYSTACLRRFVTEVCKRHAAPVGLFTVIFKPGRGANGTRYVEIVRTQGRAAVTVAVSPTGTRTQLAYAGVVAICAVKGIQAQWAWLSADRLQWAESLILAAPAKRKKQRLTGTALAARELAAVNKKIAEWTRKHKLATTKLKQYRQKQRYYERRAR